MNNKNHRSNVLQMSHNLPTACILQAVLMCIDAYLKVNFQTYIADLKATACYKQSFFCSAVLTPQHYHWYASAHSPSFENSLLRWQQQATDLADTQCFELAEGWWLICENDRARDRTRTAWSEVESTKHYTTANHKIQIAQDVILTFLGNTLAISQYSTINTTVKKTKIIRSTQDIYDHFYN